MAKSVLLPAGNCILSGFLSVLPASAALPLRPVLAFNNEEMARGSNGTRKPITHHYWSCCPLYGESGAVPAPPGILAPGQGRQRGSTPIWRKEHTHEESTHT